MIFFIIDHNGGLLQNGNERLIGAHVTLEDLTYEQLMEINSNRSVGVTLVPEHQHLWTHKSLRVSRYSLAPLLEQECI